MAERSNSLGKWKVVSEVPVINTPWLDVRNMTYDLPNGQRVEDYYLVDKPPVAVVIPLRNNKTYLIKEYERGVEQVGYKFPGGRIDAEEDAQTAAARELQEELGLRSNSLIHLGTSHIDPGLMPTTADYFLCNDFDERPDEKASDAKELFEGEWVDLTAIGDKIATNEIKNSFVIVGFTLVSNYLAKNRQ